LIALSKIDNVTWAASGAITTQGLRFLSTITISRLIIAEDIGTYAITLTIVNALLLFSDIGITPSIIQNHRSEDSGFLGTAWTMQASRGLIVSVFAILIAYPISTFYGNPKLNLLLPVIGLTALIDGLSSTRIPRYYKAGRIKEIVLLEGASQAIATIAGVTYAILTNSVWALAITALTFSSCKTLFSHIFLTGHNGKPFTFILPHAKVIFSFGKWIFLSTIFTYLSNNLDRLMLGKIMDLTTLGYYAIGTTIATFPFFTFTKVNQTILFPLFSRHNKSPSIVLDFFQQTKQAILPQITIAMLLLLASSELIIATIYPESFQPASRAINALCFCSWLSINESINGSLLISKGHPKLTAMSTSAKTFGLAILMPLLTYNYGFNGALISVCISEFFKYSSSSYILYIKYNIKPSCEVGHLILFLLSFLFIAFLRQYTQVYISNVQFTGAFVVLLFIIWLTFCAKRLIHWNNSLKKL
jgi:O-antigen/teichoic acid export membrane protein